VSEMEYTRLGRTDLRVSRICLGTWQFGGDWGSVERDDLKAAVRRGLELGINFFDTAQAYGFGESEAVLAEALQATGREDEVVIATKGGLRRTDSGIERDSSPDWLRRGVEESLRNLDVDAIDLYQVHWPDPDTPMDETAGALRELIDEGKIRHVGVSNFGVPELEEFERTLPVETVQPPYHLFRRDIEDDVLPRCRERDVGVLIYGPLAHGLLSGRMDADWRPPDGDWRNGSPLFRGDAFRRNLQVVDELRRFAEERGITVPQLAVAWTLAEPSVHVAIVGARRPAHIEGTAPAAPLELDANDLAELDRIMEAAVAAEGPSPEQRV
jgi:aryl-alcohol dehydrogenase-like predicted oxidoreductase